MQLIKVMKLLARRQVEIENTATKSGEMVVFHAHVKSTISNFLAEHLDKDKKALAQKVSTTIKGTVES